MTTLNGIPRSWDSFTQGIYARRKLVSFSRIQEECIEEEARLVTREENMGATEDKALRVHTRKNCKKKEKKENHLHKKKKDNQQKMIKRDPSNV